jgi:hypothetical protein
MTKPFTMLAVVIFSVVALLQLVRVVESWAITINGVQVPVWASVVAALLAGLMAAMVFRENRR